MVSVKICIFPFSDCSRLLRSMVKKNRLLQFVKGQVNILTGPFINIPTPLLKFFGVCLFTLAIKNGGAICHVTFTN